MFLQILLILWILNWVSHLIKSIIIMLLSLTEIKIFWGDNCVSICLTIGTPSRKKKRPQPWKRFHRALTTCKTISLDETNGQIKSQQLVGPHLDQDGLELILNLTSGPWEWSWGRVFFLLMWSRWINLHCLLSTINLAPLNGLLRMNSQT